MFLVVVELWSIIMSVYFIDFLIVLEVLEINLCIYLSLIKEFVL